MDKEKSLAALIDIYHDTERGTLRSPDYNRGHDQAVIDLAYALLGMSKLDFYVAVDKDEIRQGIKKG